MLVASLGDRASAIGALQLAIEATDLLPERRPGAREAGEEDGVIPGALDIID